MNNDEQPILLSQRIQLEGEAWRKDVRRTLFVAFISSGRCRPSSFAFIPYINSVNAAQTLLTTCTLISFFFNAWLTSSQLCVFTKQQNQVTTEDVPHLAQQLLEGVTVNYCSIGTAQKAEIEIYCTAELRRML